MILTTLGAPLLGGLLIGAATAGLLWFNGRIAGISGIVAGLFSQPSREWRWRLAFILGLLAGGSLLRLFHPQAFVPVQTGSPVVLAVAGWLVGFGAQLAHGCTSGHGVCGLARRSLRSLVATLTFMASGIGTVYVTHHW